MRCLSTFVILATLTVNVSAQELRVYTRTLNLAGLPPDQTAKAPIVARSLTLFHAGKVYDYIDSLKEVTVCEMAHRRFTILHESAPASTTITQDEVRRFLAMAEEEAATVATELAKNPSPKSRSAWELLQFQLKPDFTVAYEETAKRLRLEHERIRYVADCTQPPDVAILEQYLRYANMISELNSVLHPHSMLPGPRRALNQELLSRGLLPRTVQRQVRADVTSDLRVEHEWEWKLTDHDRQMIAGWERVLRKPELRSLDFRQFQQEVLSGRLTKR